MSPRDYETKYDAASGEASLYFLGPANDPKSKRGNSKTEYIFPNACSKPSDLFNVEYEY